MCDKCDEINASADPEVVFLLKLTLLEMDTFQAVTAMAYLEQGGIPVPSPDEFDNDAVEALLSLVDEYPFQVVIAARDAVRTTDEYKRQLQEKRDAGDLIGLLNVEFPTR